jgi:acylphosphatase
VDATDADRSRLTAVVAGAVQGVGFRWWTRAQARELGLVGYARNLPDGRVEVVAEGPRTGLHVLLDRLGGREPGRPGRVDRVDEAWTAADGGFEGFETR